MLMKYLSKFSKRHADKLLCVTGAHLFLSVPFIPAKMWAKLNTFDVQHLLLSRTDQGTSSIAWEAELKFFFEKYTANPAIKKTAVHSVETEVMD